MEIFCLQRACTYEKDINFKPGTTTWGMLITIVPGLVMEHRQSRKGFSLGLHIVLICVALVSFNPWCNMWLALSPDFFSLEANPWYYIMGVVCLFFSVRGLVQYRKLPAK